MTHHFLSPDHAVAPQISPQDIADLKAAGFVRIICNRPDMENPPALRMDVMRAAAEAEGVEYRENPVIGGGMTFENVSTQGDCLETADGKTLAYCASGTRSAILWALSQAGKLPTDEILAATRGAGYELEGMRGQIEMLARQG